MPISTNRIANLPLTGPEVKTYALALLRAELDCRGVNETVIDAMVASLATACDNDFMFRSGTAYPGITITLQVRLHYCGERAAYSIVPTFKHQNPLPDNVPLVRSVEPPLLDRGEDEHVEAFTITAKAISPNLIRVHYGMPITEIKRRDPRPGDLFPEYYEEQIAADPADYPAPEGLSVKDETEQVALAWGCRHVGEGEVMPPENDREDNTGSVGGGGSVQPTQVHAESPSQKRKQHRGAKYK
jgi:hypothetical protein